MARLFDGVDDRIDIGDVAALKITGDKISISAWVKIASKTAEKKLVAKWSDSPAAFSYLLTLDTGSNDLPRFAINNASDASAIAPRPVNDFPRKVRRVLRIPIRSCRCMPTSYRANRVHFWV